MTDILLSQCAANQCYSGSTIPAPDVTSRVECAELWDFLPQVHLDRGNRLLAYMVEGEAEADGPRRPRGSRREVSGKQGIDGRAQPGRAQLCSVVVLRSGGRDVSRRGLGLGNLNCNGAR